MHEPWAEAWPPPARAQGVAQAWLVALPLDRDPPAGWLTDAELTRAARFAFAVDRRRFAWSRRALRAILGAVRGEDPGAVAVALEPRGKPYVVGGPGFSLAHAGAWALVAVADGAIGCDLELLRGMPDLPGMARMIMAEAELTAWQALPEDARTRAFFRAWTRKEALLKARGDGFYAEPTRAVVGIEAGAHREARLDGVSWALSDLRPVPGVLAALAAPEPFAAARLALPAAVLEGR